MASRLRRLECRILPPVSPNLPLLGLLRPQFGQSDQTHTGLSLVAGSLISGRVSDYHRRQFVKNNPGSIPHAEHRLHLQILGTLVSLSGVLMYGWFVDKHIHVAGVIISTSIGTIFTAFPFAMQRCGSMAKLLPLHCPSCIRNDMGLHYDNQLPDRKLQKHTGHTRRARKLIPQSGRCDCGCGGETIDWQNGNWLVFHRSRLDGVLLCMQYSVAHV